MRAVPVEFLKAGHVVGQALLDEKGNILLNRGVVLTEDYIQAVKDRGYARLFIKEYESDEEPLIDEDLSAITRAKAFSAIKETYDAIEKDVRSLKQESFENMMTACKSDSMKALVGSRGPLARVQDAISDIMNDVLSHATLAGLTSIKSSGTAAYEHSIDVCVLTIMIGRAVGMTDSRLRQLAIGALLHDIGKIFLPDMTDERMRIVRHTRLGYELLRQGDGVDILAPTAAYQHHEHQDGTGLPRGLRGGNTIERNRNLPPPIPTLIGEITAVANEYDNLLTGVRGASPAPPDEALRSIARDAGTRFNDAVARTFLRLVPVYPQGVSVHVTSEKLKNCRGVAAEVNRTALDRPVILLFRDGKGQPISPPQRVDLSAPEYADVTIRSALM